MTKLLSLFVAIALLSTAAQCSQQKAVQHNMNLEWEEFKQAFDKVYTSPEHEREHQQEFLRRREEIRAHNAAFEKGHASYRVGFSHLSDLTPEEFQKMNGFRVSLDGMQHLLANGGGKFQQFSTKNINMGSLPDSVDWRTGGNGTNATSTIPLVTSVKNQYSCGSCWAFSTVGVLESAHARATGRLIDLSPQNLVDCDVTNAGCNGGFPMMALAFSIDEGGLNLERYYSYQGYRQQCKFNKQYPIAASMVNAVVPLPPGNEKALMAAVAMQGPISVAIEVTYNFQAYAGGVFVDRACSSKLGDLNHAVLVVGYGTDSKWGDYWIVKNSWGSYWGEDGYIRMARNRNNQCGIATQAVYAQIEN